MKTIVAIVVTIVLTTVGLIYFMKKNEPATRGQLEEVRKELSLKIDSVSKKSDSIITITKTINRKIDSMSKNIDSIKFGEAVIYDEVKKQTQNNFWNNLKNLMP